MNSIEKDSYIDAKCAYPFQRNAAIILGTLGLIGITVACAVNNPHPGEPPNALPFFSAFGGLLFIIGSIVTSCMATFSAYEIKKYETKNPKETVTPPSDPPKPGSWKV